PLQFITHAWRDGPVGALRMGVEHGAWCVGCCWALMAGLFALGVMSVGWMVLIAALIAGEKLLPWKAAANLAVAAIMVALAIAVGWRAATSAHASPARPDRGLDKTSTYTYRIADSRSGAGRGAVEMGR